VPCTEKALPRKEVNTEVEKVATPWTWKHCQQNSDVQGGLGEKLWCQEHKLFSALLFCKRGLGATGFTQVPSEGGASDCKATAEGLESRNCQYHMKEDVVEPNAGSIRACRSDN